MEEPTRSWRDLPSGPPESRPPDVADPAVVARDAGGEPSRQGFARPAEPTTEILPPPATRPVTPAIDSQPPPPSWWPGALIGAVTGILGALLILGLTGNLSDETGPTADQAVEQAVVEGPADTGRVAAVAARVIPSIVTVQVFDIADAPDSLTGTGSGVVFRSDGLILTNNHVIENATQIKVTLADGRTFVADMAGTDPLTDIAVVSIGASELPTVDFADLDSVAIGDVAVAVGNPLGLEGGPSVTAGVVSAFNRELEVDPLASIRLNGLVQTDAPITRGSSGGALVDSNGDLIGITTAIGVSDVGAEGLGFAVPIDLVAGVAQDLVSTGQVRHAFLGIEGSPAFATTDGVEVPVGAEIRRLTPGSAIGAAGAQAGDVIIALDGEQVASMNLLITELRGYRAGQTVEVELDRGGERIVVELVLDERPENP